MAPMRRTILLKLVAAGALGVVVTITSAWAFSRRGGAGGVQRWRFTRERSGHEGRGLLLVLNTSKLGRQSWLAQAVWAEPMPQAWPGPAPESMLPRDVRRLAMPWVFGDEPWPLEGQRSTNLVCGFGWPLPSIAAVRSFRSGSSEWSFVLPIRGLATDPLNIPPGFYRSASRSTRRSAQACRVSCCSQPMSAPPSAAVAAAARAAVTTSSTTSPPAARSAGGDALPRARGSMSRCENPPRPGGPARAAPCAGRARRSCSGR
jgi:hypothetical protein